MLRTQRAKALATLLHDRAVLDQARLNLGYTVIKAPVDGAVGDRAARVGLYVRPGTQLMTIVPMGTGVYVVANYKETQIGRMFRGEAADISVDAFPGTHLHGTLDSLAPGQRSGIRAAAAGKRHREFHQDRTARAGQDPDRSDQ